MGMTEHGVGMSQLIATFDLGHALLADTAIAARESLCGVGIEGIDSILEACELPAEDDK